MKGYLYGILPATPFLLGNSAGGLAGLGALIIAAIIGIGAIIAIIWGLMKWLM